MAVISGNTLANPTVVTTATNHGLISGQSATIAGSNSTPVIDGVRVVTVLSPTTFSVPVNCSGAGTAGTVSGPNGRVERIDSINSQIVDQTAQSQRATQLPPQSAATATKTVTWQTVGDPAIS